MATSMAALEAELAKMRSATLADATAGVDRLIDLLTAAREQVAGASDPHTASLTITKLQNPVKEGFERVNDALREISKRQKNYGKALDKAVPIRALPTEYDPLAQEPYLINRAIAMHLLREGQFTVASTFLREAEAQDPDWGISEVPLPVPIPARGPSHAVGDAADEDEDEDMDMDMTTSFLHGGKLQDKFARMYAIRGQLKARNLVPAIEWAQVNSAELEARGSNLEFELCRLQFVWLFKGGGTGRGGDASSNAALSNLLDGYEGEAAMDGRANALAYARENFGRFQARHLREIQQLSCAMVYASNIAESPYRALFDTSTAFADVALSFTREFCSLLGLSAESPLYLAATAGAIALPQVLKYAQFAKAKRTEWTTEQELAFETPLPTSMIYHPIFVCPVTKEQTTEQNPPMMLPCGHVVCKESLQRLSKGSKFKCPYCPVEGRFQDAKEIFL